MANNPEIEDVVAAWTAYANTIENWEDLVKGITPKATDCGPVYELPNTINRPNESFAIADMRELKISGPHYHTGGEIEVYIVLTGLGRVFVGGKESELSRGSVSVTPPHTTHFTVPTENLVLAVVNTPPFNPKNAVSITETNPQFGFDEERYSQLKAEAASRT